MSNVRYWSLTVACRLKMLLSRNKCSSASDQYRTNNKRFFTLRNTHHLAFNFYSIVQLSSSRTDDSVRCANSIHGKIILYFEDYCFLWVALPMKGGNFGAPLGNAHYK